MMNHAGEFSKEQATQDLECYDEGLGSHPRALGSHGRVLFTIMK